MRKDSKLKYILKVTIVALFITSVSSVQGVHGGSPSNSPRSVKIFVSANVRERTTMRVLNQVQDIVVSHGDIMRGYVEMNAATRIQVISNNPAGYLLVFEVMGVPNSIFNLATLHLGNREVQLPQGGGWVRQPYVRGGAVLDISYRFSLLKDTKPGTYSWPLIISVLPI
jgi:hypothetical protein